MKTFKKYSAGVAMLAASAMLFAACSPGGTDDAPDTSTDTEAEETTEEETDEGGEAGGQQYTVEPHNTGYADLGDVTTEDGSIAISVGEVEYMSYNGMTPQTYNTYNSAVNDLMFQSFVYFGTDGEIYPNEEFGSFEVVNEDPLTVEYTINDEAVWSDGTQVTAADFMFDWGVQNPRIVNADGEPIFNPVSQTLGEYVEEAPEGDPAGKQFTLTFKEPNPDWQLMVSSPLPVHVVAAQTGTDVETLIDAVLAEDADALADAAEFWNTGWSVQPGELPDESVAPSMGPYTYGSWEAGQSITMTANENYWGTPPATKEIVIRFAAADTHMQALQNEELNVIEPQASVDTLEQLKAMGDSVVVHQFETLIWEHLDYNFVEGSLFADNLELRQAFAYCVPRQLIVDNLIKPLNPDAVVMNAREVFPFQETYDEVVDAAYSGEYDEVNIEKAKELIEASGVTELDVRIGYSAPNPRRSETVALIQSTCGEAGFNIIDEGASDFFAEGGAQERGDYEVALFAWSGSGQIASGRNIYHTEGGQNFGEFSNPDVDDAWDVLAGSLDTDVHLTQVKEIEKLLWDNLYGIPLYAHPGIVANSADIANVRATATQAGVLWNAPQWVRVSR